MARLLTAALLLVTLFFVACTTSPTGRSQLIAFSDNYMSGLGSESFTELKQQSKVSSSRALNQYVNCISDKLLRVIGEKPASWEVKVFDDESLNAFALPGNKIGIHTGMIKFASRDELAAVVGHEIAHVKARHGAERMTMGMANQALMVSSAVLLEHSEYKEYAGVAVAALAIGAQYGVILPYSQHMNQRQMLWG